MLTNSYSASENKSLFKKHFNPLTPRGDQHETSPYNILTLSSKHVMRIYKYFQKHCAKLKGKKNITNKQKQENNKKNLY